MPTRSFAPLALVLVVLFATIVAGALFPVQLLDPGWQWRLSTALLNSAPLPLIALALLQVAVVLDPEDELLQRRRRLFGSLAVAAALGLLLLLPLAISAGLRLQSGLGTTQAGRIAAAERHLSALRQAVEDAGSNAAINRSLLRLQGPVLGPADLANPTPVLKAQLRALFEQAQIRINRERAALPSTPAATALPDLLRNGIACLALAWGYAAFARRPGAPRSLLEELQNRLAPSLSRRGRRFRSAAQADYIRRLHGGDDDREP